MQIIIAPIQSGDSGASVLNLQDALPAKKPKKGSGSFNAVSRA